MPRIKKVENKQKSIAIQTDNIDSNAEIIRLQEQLKILQLENDTLKKRVDGNNHPVNDLYNKTKRESIQSPRRVNNKSPIEGFPILKSATKPKICNCKGNCSTRVCGCVKNERKCGLTCNCNNEMCQNQELENKENIGDLPNEITYETKKLKNVGLRNKTEHLFSPAGPENDVKLDNISYEPICFDTPKKLKYASDEELGNKDTIKVKNDIIKRRNRNKKEHESVDDKANSTAPTKEVAKIKIKKTNASKNNKKIAQESNEIESEQQESSSNVEANEKPISEADTKFDPMKPKHQLPRTPPHTNIEYDSSPNIPVSAEAPVQKIKQTVDAIPKELNQEKVDLNELSIEFVKCDRCKRNFYPWRVEVHKAVCLGR